MQIWTDSLCLRKWTCPNFGTNCRVSFAVHRTTAGAFSAKVFGGRSRVRLFWQGQNSLIPVRVAMESLDEVCVVLRYRGRYDLANMLSRASVEFVVDGGVPLMV